MTVWLYDVDAFSFLNSHNAVEYIVEHMEQTKKLFELRSLTRWGNEFWYGHWTMKRQQVEKKKHYAEIVNTIYKLDREIALWRSGDTADRFWNRIFNTYGED